MAYSAAGKNEEAYKTANGSIAKYTNNIEKAISSMREHVNSVTQEERKSLESTYRASVVTCTFTIAVSLNCITVCCFCCCHHGYQASASYTEGNQRHHSQY